MTSERTTVHIALPTKDERELLRLLTPAEKLAVLLDAARRKAARLGEPEPDSDT